ncbi:MAG: rhodanese-like domain-containing protein [Gammaproteobacteria bacterium]|nr:rhodanese-like domain-containing protein [Gammaproteobacteria bacterium]
MKFLQIITLISVLFTGAALAHSDHDHQTREQIGWNMIAQGALIIDARTAKEYADGHVKGAINIPFDIAVTQFNAMEIRKDRNVVLYCRSGNRSGKAFQSLKAAGYINLHNAGGFSGMIKAK